MTQDQVPVEGYTVESPEPTQSDRVQLEISRETHEYLLRVQSWARASSPDELLRWALNVYTRKMADFHAVPPPMIDEKDS